MDAISVIESWFEQISWSDETSLKEVSGYVFAETNSSIYFPFHYLGGLNHLSRLKEIASQRGLRLTLLIHGNPPDDSVEKMWRIFLHQHISCWWIEPIPQIVANELMYRSLDGIDWGRSLTQKRPIMEWE
jgi:hypothetical protein